MLDMSWGEVMLIGGVALIVIGPKDLPKALRTVGQVTTKLRRMAGEFQMQFNEAIREAELDEVRKEVDGIRNTARSASNFNPVQTIRDELKGAVEGRAKAVEPAPVETASAEAMGPHKPPVEPKSLADATAQLRAEQDAGSTDTPAHEAAASSDVPPARNGHATAAAAVDEPPPMPGSVDDPFGMPPEPAPAPPETAKNGTAAR